MSDDIRQIRDDISYVRGLLRDDGSVLKASGIGLATVGVVFGLASLRSFALAQGWLQWPAALRALMPWDATVIFLVLLFTLLMFSGRHTRAAGAAISATSRTVWASWAAVGIGYMVVAASLPAVGAGATAAVLFALWGNGWLVASAAYRRIGFAIAAIGCYAVALASGRLADTPYEELLIALALLVLVGLPGLLILRQTRSAA